MKVALVHYWLTGMRGGEKVLEALCELYPDADIFTLVVAPEQLSPTLQAHKITTSFLQRIGGVKHYKKMLALMPFALEAFDVTEYDLIISSEAGPAKGIVPAPNALHICYCHSPMRYVWDLFPQYQSHSGRFTRLMMSIVGPMIRQWDVTTAARVDHFVSNSRFVAKRIEKYYRRDATVIHPPVDIDRFPAAEGHDDYYLCAGQITPYKKVELAVEACTRLNRRLVVIGSGATNNLRNLAGPTVEFLGPVSDEEMRRRFASCRALLYPGLEDFGMVPVEVMAAGRPVIAYGAGGALETVVAGANEPTGLFFHTQTVDAMADAIERFEEIESQFTIEACQRRSRDFSRERFKAQMSAFIQQKLIEQGVPA